MLGALGCRNAFIQKHAVKYCQSFFLSFYLFILNFVKNDQEQSKYAYACFLHVIFIVPYIVRCSHTGKMPYVSMIAIFLHIQCIVSYVFYCVL